MKQPKRNVFTGLRSFKPASAEQLKAHVESVRKNVIPNIKEELRAKEKGAQRAKSSYKVF